MVGKTLGVIMDPIDNINYHKDTTLALLLAAQRAGYRLYYMELGQLFLENGHPRAEMRALEVFEDKHRWHSLGPIEVAALESLDAQVLPSRDPTKQTPCKGNS